MGHDSRGSRARVVAAFSSLLLLVLILALGWWQRPEPTVARHAPRAVQRDEVATAAPASLEQDVRTVAASPASVGPAEPAVIRTFLDGEPVRSLLHDLAITTNLRAAWEAAKPVHEVPTSGDRFVLLARDCVVVFLSRSRMPERGELRVDLRRAPVLDVRLVHVPPTLRDKLDLQLQVMHGSVSGDENVASCLMRDRAPVRMTTDRVLVPLALGMPGHIALHAISRHSTHSYPTPDVAFEPVSQVIELDLSMLESACHLATLRLQLRFPFAHPDESFCLTMQDERESNMMFQRATRNGAGELSFVFRDLPRATVYPLVSFEGRRPSPQIHLQPLDLTAGDADVVREVVAESSLRVVLSGREGLEPNGVSVLLETVEGKIVQARWPEALETRFDRLPANDYLVQAIAYDGRRCSTIAKVRIGVAAAHEVALQLVPAARLFVAPGAFGGAPHVDVRFPQQEPSRVCLRRDRETTVWLPVGSPRVTWDGGEAAFVIEPGRHNRWP